MRLTAQNIIAMAFLLQLTACTNHDQSASIADVRKEELVVLRHTKNTGHVYSISIRGIGNIDGEANISLVLNGEPYKTEKLKGKVNFDWGGDWYSDTAEIRYLPINVNSGEIVIEYKFSTLKRSANNSFNTAPLRVARTGRRQGFEKRSGERSGKAEAG
jgi:hypothetical protein